MHWDKTEQAARLLPGVTRCHPLPYGDIKRRHRIHRLAAYATLAAHAEHIADDHYDHVVNLSSTRLACLVAPVLAPRANTITGPCIDGQGNYVASHPAIAYLNDWGVDPELNVFAHQDLYATAAGVDLLGYSGLPVNAAAAEQAQAFLQTHGVATGARVIAVQLHASEAAKDWRDAFAVTGWRGLIGELRRRFGAHVLLLGAPHDEPLLEPVAAQSGGILATLPLGVTAELLRGCAGLVSVDTVAVHLAAQVHCPTVVLRDGPAQGSAFIPGLQATLVDEARQLGVSDVAALCGKVLFEEPLWQGAMQPLSAASVWQVDRNNGYLLAQSPRWLAAPVRTLQLDRCRRSWQDAWSASWQNHAADVRGLDRLLFGPGRAEERRRTHVLTSHSPLGERLRALWGGGQAA